MTIKEIEEATGMSRANIRFYENEGLISPQRNRENGYRIYSQEDVQVLKKIRLLRLLDVSIEEVRSLQQGDKALEQVLQRNLDSLTQKQEQLRRTEQVARQIVERKEDYGTMNAENYLDALENEEALRQDVKPRLNLPWRRFWARSLDHLLYALLVDAVLAAFPRWQNLASVLTLFAMLVLEPLLLYLFATTPGKAIFGIRVLNPEEGKLSYGDGLVRTWTVMWEGEALRVPLVSDYFRYRSLTAAENDQTLSWEWDSDLTFKDDKNWRYILYFAAFAALTALDFWVIR